MKVAESIFRQASSKPAFSGNPLYSKTWSCCASSGCRAELASRERGHHLSLPREKRRKRKAQSSVKR